MSMLPQAYYYEERQNCRPCKNGHSISGTSDTEYPCQQPAPHPACVAAVVVKDLLKYRCKSLTTEDSMKESCPGLSGSPARTR